MLWQFFFFVVLESTQHYMRMKGDTKKAGLALALTGSNNLKERWQSALRYTVIYHSFYPKVKRTIFYELYCWTLLVFLSLSNASHPLLTILWCATNLKTFSKFNQHRLLCPYSVQYLLCDKRMIFGLWVTSVLEKVNNSGFNIWTERESYSSFLSRPWSPTVNCRQAMNQFLTLGSEVCLWAVCHIRQRYLRRTLSKAYSTLIRPTWPGNVEFNLIPNRLLHLVKTIWLNIYAYL